MKLDARDVQILIQLQKDARIKIADLANRINLSVTPCWARVKRLEKAGFITGYHASIDLLRLPNKITEIFVPLTLEEHRASAFQKFESAIDHIPEIVSCHAVAGGIDYMLRFLVRDITHYQAVIDQLLGMNIGIKTYFTYVITKAAKTQHIYSAEVLAAAGAHSDSED